MQLKTTKVWDISNHFFFYTKSKKKKKYNMRIFIYFFSHSFFLKYKITSKHFELDRALFDLVSFHILFFYSHIKVKKFFPKKKINPWSFMSTSHTNSRMYIEINSHLYKNKKIWNYISTRVTILYPKNSTSESSSTIHKSVGHNFVTVGLLCVSQIWCGPVSCARDSFLFTNLFAVSSLFFSFSKFWMTRLDDICIYIDTVIHVWWWPPW